MRPHLHSGIDIYFLMYEIQNIEDVGMGNDISHISATVVPLMIFNFLKKRIIVKVYLRM